MFDIFQRKQNRNNDINDNNLDNILHKKFLCKSSKDNFDYKINEKNDKNINNNKNINNKNINNKNINIQKN
jgi:hypothetical protein